MKDYITTSNEYDIVTRRLKRLYAKKEKLEIQITNITSTIKEVVVNGGTSDDKMSSYVAEKEQIEIEIREKEIEAAELKDDLEYMDSRLSNINELKEQIFVMYFIRGMKVKDIALKAYCDISTVYKKIKEINKERELAKKIQKYSDTIIS